MSFPHDGSNHKNAIENEKSTKRFLEDNAHLIFPELQKGKYVVEGKGGTTHKADNIIIPDDGNVINISDKEKRKGIKIGSFDYTNSSKAIKEMVDGKEPNVRSLKRVVNKSKKDRELTLAKRKKLVNEYRTLVANASYEALAQMTTKQIIGLLKNYLVKPNSDMQMFITDGITRKRYIFPFINHPVVSLIENNYIPSIQVKLGKSSGHVIFTKGDDVQNVGLRIRIHTNNGVSALLGLSKSNAYSQFVFKFQQDSVPNLIESVDPIEI